MGTGCSKQQILSKFKTSDRVPDILARTLYHKNLKQTTGFTFLRLKILQENKGAKHKQSTKNLMLAIKMYCCPLYQHSIIINTQAHMHRFHTYTHIHKTDSSHNSSCLAITMATKSTAHQPGKHRSKFY